MLLMPIRRCLDDALSIAINSLCWETAFRRWLDVAWFRAMNSLGWETVKPAWLWCYMMLLQLNRWLGLDIVAWSGAMNNLGCWWWIDLKLRAVNCLSWEPIKTWFLILNPRNLNGWGELLLMMMITWCWAVDCLVWETVKLTWFGHFGGGGTGGLNDGGLNDVGGLTLNWLACSWSLYYINKHMKNVKKTIKQLISRTRKR